MEITHRLPELVSTNEVGKSMKGEPNVIIFMGDK